MESCNGFRQYIDEAVKFWEPRRILYNLLLTAVTVFWFVLGWSHFRPGINLQLLLVLLVLAAGKCLLLRSIPGRHSPTVFQFSSGLAAQAMVALDCSCLAGSVVGVLLDQR